MVEPPRQRVVLLGASNLARCFSTIIEASQRLLGAPLSILATPGHGRSYGIASSLLGRRLPGIVTCGLWDELQRTGAAPTYALLTDVGNDLMYGVAVSEIIAWVSTCLDRLEAANAQIVMTLLPVVSLETLSERRYTLFRTLFYPRNRADLATMRGRALDLNEQLVKLGKQRKLIAIPPRDHWYGFDPIHIRRSQARAAWQEVLASWNAAQTAPPLARGSWRHWVYVHRLRPLERSVWGFAQRSAQPAGRLRSGTTLALY